MKECIKCNSSIDDDAVFCPNCGEKIETETVDIGSNNSVQENIKNTVNKVNNNEFVESVKQDVKNSQSIGIIKDQVKTTASKVKTSDGATMNKIKAIAIIVVVAIVVLIVGTHIHHCDECDKIYFGNKHEITYWGETENMCGDCYDDYYSFW